MKLLFSSMYQLGTVLRLIVTSFFALIHALIISFAFTNLAKMSFESRVLMFVGLSVLFYVMFEWINMNKRSQRGYKNYKGSLFNKPYFNPELYNHPVEKNNNK